MGRIGMRARCTTRGCPTRIFGTVKRFRICSGAGSGRSAVIVTATSPGPDSALGTTLNSHSTALCIHPCPSL